MSSTIQAYLESLHGRRVAVIGIGISNTPLIKMLLRAGVSVTACDKKSDRAEFCGVIEELESLGAEIRLGPGYLDCLDQDVIFRTPGMRPDVPELVAARARGSTVTSEMEVFFQVCPCKIVGVTGSDGKTTTTTIVAELLKRSGYHVYVGGNIGKPLLAETAGMAPDDLVVLELSSFQLMTMCKSPDIAVVTNLAPNHLDVHRSMEEYITAKENIFIHQDRGGRAVFNYDNEITRGLSEKARGRAVLFSRETALERGVYVKDGAVWIAGEDGARRVLPLDDILLPGEHNVENYMAAICAVDGLVSDETIRSFAQSFNGVEHRIELVRTLDGVRYYNDSIASSPSRTIAGLRSFREKVILIAGGYDKHIPFDILGPEIVAHVKELILTGDTAGQICDAVRRTPGYTGENPPISLFGGFEQAVLAARSMARPGDVVILSPACASFDRFKNFMERGDAFKKIVREF